MKRIISLMLSLIIILSLVCVAAPSASAASAMKTSTNGINMIKSFEGFAKWPHEDNGQWTVGYGTGVTGEKLEQYRKNGITEADATKLLTEYLGEFEKSVNTFIDTHKLVLPQHRFDALVCFTYNLGPSWMQSNGIFRSAVINGTTGNDFVYAMAQFGKSGGVPVGGLIERRLCEANLYLNGIYGTTPPVNFKYVTYNGNLEGATPDVSIQGYVTTMNSAVKATVSKSGYRFLGWYSKDSGGEWITTLNSRTAAVKDLYAHWQQGEGELNTDGSIKGAAVEYSGYAPKGAQKTYAAPNGAESGSVKADEKVKVVADYVDSKGVKWGKLSTGKWLVITGGLAATPSYEAAGSAISPITVTVTANGINNRIGPGTNYAKQGTYVKGQKLTLTAVQKGGNYVWGKSDQGWIALIYTDYETSKLENNPAANKVTATGVIIKANTVNVRSGAGTQYPKVGTYKRDDKIKITLRQKVGNNTWGLTEKGWVSLYYVKVTEVEAGSVPDIDVSVDTSSGSTTGGTTSGGTTSGSISSVTTGMIYNCDVLRVRSGAGTSNAHIADYARGTYVTIYETTTVRSELWGRTDKGWISLRYVKLDAPTSGLGVTGRVVKCNILAVRSGAGTHYPKVGQLAKGTKVEIMEYTKVGNATWGRTAQGWISLYYVSLDTPITNLDVPEATVPAPTIPEATEPPVTKYVVGATAMTNGRVTVNTASAAKGEVIVMTVTPSAGYELDTLTVKDASNAALSVTDNKFTMPASNVTISATFKVAAAKYSVTINSAKNGKVTSSTTSCAAGTEVAVTVAPDAGYELDTLTAMNTTVNTPVTVSNGKFTMPAGNVNLVATFKTASADTYKVAVNSASNGSVTANTTAAKAGDTVILTIAAADGYELDELSVMNVNSNAAVAVSGTGNTRTFTMPASKVTIAATFKVVKYNVAISATTNGSVSTNPSQYSKGQTVSLCVVANTGYEVDKLVVKDASNGSVNVVDNKFTMPASNVTVSVTFKKIGYNVNIAAVSNGTVTAASTAKMGETVALTIAPSTGYVLDTLVVKDADGNVLTVSDKKFTMPASDVTVTATFTTTKYLVEIDSAIVNGTVKVNPGSAAKGETVAVTITPAAGYELDKLTVKDSADKDVTVTSNQFTMPEGKVKVSATFKKSTLKVNVATATDGKVVAAATTATVGDTVALTITPNANCELVTLVVKDAAGKVVAVSADNKFTMPGSDVTVTATFRKIPVEYNVTVDGAIANGTVTASETKAKNGDTVTLIIAAVDGYKLKSLTIKAANGTTVTPSGTGNVRTFTMPANNVEITATFEANS